MTFGSLSVGFCDTPTIIPAFHPLDTITALFRTNFRMDFPFDLQELPAFAVIGSVGSPSRGVVRWEWVYLRIRRDPRWEEGGAHMGESYITGERWVEREGRCLVFGRS